LFVFYKPEKKKEEGKRLYKLKFVTIWS